MSDNRDLFTRGRTILNDRQQWEDKQRLFYIMRHRGKGRSRKPWANAADLHMALIDEAVTKWKQFTMAQVINAPRLATFIAMRQQLAETTESAADFFSFELKERTNLMRCLETAVDTMWLRGRGVIKSYVDPFDDYKIVHENVDPLYVLFPETCDDFGDAYEWVHVRQIPVAKFKMDRRYLNDVAERDTKEQDKRINLMRGGKDAVERMKGQLGQDFTLLQQDKELREGYTHSDNKDTIILWEHYVRTMGGITVNTYCPTAIDIEVRKQFGVPYKVGGRVSAPFFSFQAEVKDEGWYSPRGVAEKIFDKEIYASEVWSCKADAITLYNTPMLTSETPIQNPANYRIAPGEYMPGNARFVQGGQPAISFDQEINFARMESEQAAQMPDFGIQKPGQSKGEKRTATENNRIASLQAVGQNHTGNIFKDSLVKLFRHDWGLMLQYKRKSLTYFISEDLQTLPEQAMHDEYLIQVGGSTEDWDKAARVQKALQRLEAFKGAPNVNQDELVKGVLQADDARLVKKLLVPQAQKAASEAEDEAMEIVIMTDGFPAMVKPGEDHATRIKVLLGWMEKQGMQRQPVDKVAQQRIHEHLAVHMKYLKELQPEAFKALMAEIQQKERAPMQGAPQMSGSPMGARPQPRAMPPRRQMQPVGGGMRRL